MEGGFDQMKTVKDKVVDAGTKIRVLQLLVVQGMTRMEVIREFIDEADLQSLEESTGESAEILDTEVPGVREKYDSLVRQLNDPNLTLARFRTIVTTEISEALSQGTTDPFDNPPK